MDEYGFRQAFRDHKDSVYAFAYRMTSSVSAADDLTQDCFLELFRRPERFDSQRGSLRHYLFGIVHKLALKRARREHRFLPLDGDLPLPSPNSIPLDAALAISIAVQSLSLLQREALILFEYEGLTLEETAVVTKCDVGTVKSRLYRARKNLRQILAPLHTQTRGS